MTAIAYKNGVLAVDSLLTEEDYRFATADKVRVIDTGKHGVWLIACSGEVGNYTAMADFLEDFITQEGPEGRDSPLTEEEFFRRISREYAVDSEGSSGSVLVVAPTGATAIFYAKTGFGGIYTKETPQTLGVVWQYLRGAMDAGAPPEKAVRLAIENHGSCGDPLRVYVAGLGESNAVLS